MSYSYVAKYVHRRRPQVAAQAAARDAARAGVVAGFVPQCHPPGAEAEVDFADLWVRLAGEMTKCFLFTLRLSHSGRAVHRVFASQGQEAFLEGHVAAFEALGGVPFDKIRYDNLQLGGAPGAVRAQPRGVAGAGWRSGRTTGSTRSTACPARRARTRRAGWRATVAGSAAPIWSRCRRSTRWPSSTRGWSPRTAAEDDRHIDGRAVSVGAAFAVEAPLLRPLPGERFDTALSLTARVDRYAQIMVRQVRYSVPARLIGSRVRVALLGLASWWCSTAAARVATHPRVLSPRPRGPRAGPLPGDSAGQARCAAGVDRAGPGPRGGEVHRDP